MGVIFGRPAHFSVTLHVGYVTRNIACSLCDSWACCNDVCTKLRR